MKEVKIKLVADTKTAEKNIKDVDSSIKDTSASTNQLTGTLDKMSGGAVSGFKAFATGLKTVALGFRTVGGAIAASGLGLLVITISALTAAFRGSEEGQNKFSKIMGVIGAVTGNLIDLLADLGDKIISVFENPKQAVIDFTNLLKENIINRFEGMLELIPALGTAIGQLFDGEFAAAAETAGNAFGKVALGVEDVTGKIGGAIDASKDFVKQNLEEGKAAAKVADMRAKADKVERGLLVRRAEAEREVAKLRLVAKDMVNTSAEERKAALEKVLEIQDSLIGSEQEVANLRRDAQTMENGFARSTKENLEEEERLKAESIAVETRRLNQKRQIARELSAAEMELIRNKTAAEKEAADKKKVIDEAEATRLKSISDFKKDLVKKDEDNDAKTEEEKLELERTRAEEALERLVGTEEEKREALLALNEYYDQKESDLEDKRIEDKKVKDIEADKEEIARKKALERAKDSLRDASLNAIAGGLNILKSLNEESKGLQAAALLGESGLGVAKMVIGKNTADLADTAFAATLGPAGPAYLTTKLAANKINLITGLASTAAATAKGLQSLGKSGGGRGSDSSGNNAETPQAPSFNLVEGTGDNSSVQRSIENQGSNPIKAYVVSGEVQSQASLDRSIQDSSSI